MLVHAFQRSFRPGSHFVVEHLGRSLHVDLVRDRDYLLVLQINAGGYFESGDSLIFLDDKLRLNINRVAVWVGDHNAVLNNGCKIYLVKSIMYHNLSCDSRFTCLANHQGIFSHISNVIGWLVG